MARRLTQLALCALVLAALLAPAAHAVAVPKETRSSLADRSMVAADASVVSDVEPMSMARPFAKAAGDRFEAFKLGVEGEWSADVDRRTGLVTYAEGEGVPFIPGRGNHLNAAALKSIAPNGRIDIGTLEKATRAFLPQVAPMLGVDPAELVLNQSASGQPAAHIWFVDFGVKRGGYLVEGAHVVFRVNNGNLIQFGTENLPAPGVAVPGRKIGKSVARVALGDYLGGLYATDRWIDDGSLHMIPVNIADEGEAEGYLEGAGRGLLLVWQFTFKREGEPGTWRGRVDASSGEVVDFLDLNEYGQATGGTYKGDRPAPETVMPLPWANVATGVYTNSAGIFSGTTGTTTLNGQYVAITDSCGSISKAADGSGTIALGSSTGTDCTVPSGGGGAGNTHAARTQFYMVNRGKEAARGWLPSNTWLQAKVTAAVNLNQTCNAYWDGTKLNFFKSGGGCANTGELPGVSLHEWGHGMDTNDGNGDSPDNGTGETYGDVSAMLAIHSSCTGNGFLGSNCSGYGNACTSCSGVRDSDYAKHSRNTPSTVNNFTRTDCPAPSANNPNYVGPCGADAMARGNTSNKREGHCESQVSTEAAWDLANRDLPNAGSGAAWATLDRLWYLSRSTATAAFTCNTSGGTRTSGSWTSSGCSTGSMFRVFRAIDDDNGNLNDGTPHGGAIAAAMNRHGMACTTDTGWNTTFAAVAPPAAPALSITAGSNSASLSWSGSSGVYDVYRNETGCSAGFIKAANDLTGTTFTDTNVANGFTYYYQVTAQPSGNEAAASAPSSCISVTPQAVACTPPAAPTGVTASSGTQSTATVSWTASSGATSYTVLRSTTSGSGYVSVGTTSSTSFNDSGLNCGTTYYYVVTASNGTCSSGNSAQASAATAACVGLAAYDATLKAPKCGAVGNTCDTGTSLVLGRNALGPEPNQPNTINNSCADGASGAFHTDESNDRLKIYTTGGGNFAAGVQVRVEATVWAYSTFSADHLDLYYAANANSPTWTLIGTVNPTAAGTQVLTATYTLPSGSLQAVRAAFRYQGSATSCSTGSYDDRDDLIFAVTAAANNPPTANFTSTTSGLTANFTDTSTDSDGTIASRSWNFGDGGTSTATNPSHTYAAAGTYTVSLTVTDNLGATGSTSKSVTVSAPTNNPPTANFTFTTSTLTANFTDTSTDSDGTIASRSWNFGDSTTSTATNPSHTYAAAGTYTVSLTVTDNLGATGSTSKSVTVTAPPSCTTYSGTLSSPNSAIQPNGTYYQSTVSGNHTGHLVGPAGSDFDLYLYRWSGSAWVNVKSATTASNIEDITYAGTAAYYYWKVTAYSGSGIYTLCIAHP